MAQFQLKNWYFTTEGDAYCSCWLDHGNVYGNPKFPEGYHIHTSAVQHIEAREESLLVHTRNSVYRCGFCDCKETDFQFMEETDLFLPLTVDDLTALKKRILNCRRTYQEQEEGRLRSMIPAEGDCFLMVFTDLDEYYFQDAILWESSKPIHFSRRIHLGMFQDSVLINRPLDDGEERWVDFRYFPYMLNSLKFYSWKGFAGPVYAANQGVRTLQVITRYGTFSLLPDGQPYRIDGFLSGDVPKSDIPRIGLKD